ncbi:sensor histidine kinase [Streptacidiphilus pinicola]|uniref:histidine kinase n=1 Tax=Streptacidiphilus pinicola TaxID=2219663 RepID=A0A2X0IT19_9ACTN|nr:sensor histidine kinase [Streptacidiphilus pinicola]RAG86421.1 sensor histidine kinase [Streptacidiphilus pinicola]
MIRRWQLYLRRHPRAADLWLAVLLFVATGPGAAIPTGASKPGAWWPPSVVGVVACGAIMWRRSHPRAVVVVTAACATTVSALGYLPSALLLGPLMVALYSLVVRATTRTTVIYASAAIAAVLVATLLGRSTQGAWLVKTVVPTSALLLPLAIGQAVRLHRAWLGAERARAEYAERTREEEARQRVVEERLRIARELHDVVAHHLALANAQAGAVSRLIARDPARAQEFVDQLTDTTSAALRELKATVGLMRQGEDADAPLEPAPGLAQLPQLTDSLAGTGLHVAVVIDGEPRPLSPGTDLTAFRIIQEALTNVTKHAATDHAQVRLSYTRNRLTITVTDEGPGTDAPSAVPGYGVLGMRERAQSLGGRLDAGRRAAGGFEVTAELPLDHRLKEHDT